MTNKDFVIIGGGIAGWSAIKAIREEDTSSPILWVTNEDRIPYKRTQINKHIASGFSKDEFALISHEYLVDNHIELLYDQVELIDTEKHELTFHHRGHLRYKKLIIATGKKPNTLDLGEFPVEKIFHINTARQVENIIRTASKSENFLIIGAGIEGVETASELAAINKNVVLIEKNKHVIERFFTPRFSRILEEEIKSSGIKLILNTQKIEYAGKNMSNSIINIDGEPHEFHAVITTIGYSPNIKIAQKSNIKCKTGILVNEHLQTSAIDIFAAGDVAEHPSGAITGLWHAAEYQGYIAGKNALGKTLTMKLKPFRMKTEVFNGFYFSFPPNDTNDNEIISEEKNGIIRDLYFKNKRLEAILMKNDKERAKEYQQALMEHWTLEQIHKKLPL
jgi:NAD(P)H-nitrite reductase large subunit